MSEVARLTIQVNANAGRAMAQLALLNRQLQHLNRQNQKSADIAKQAAQALRNQANATRSLIRMNQRGSTATLQMNNATRNGYNNLLLMGDGVITVTRRTRGFTGRMRQAHADIANFNGLVGSMTKSLMGAATAFLMFSAFAISPIIIGLTGVLGQLVSVLGVAAMSLGAFFVAVIGSDRASAALEKFSDRWRAWQNSVAKWAAPPVEHFFKVLGDNLTQLNPLVKTTSGLMMKGSKAMERFFQTEQFKSWLEDVRVASEKMLPDLGSAFGDFLIGLMEIIRAFLPLGGDFTEWLRGAGARFRKWSEELSESDGFKRFSAWLYENGPKMMTAFRRILTAIRDLIWEVREFGMVAFRVFTNVAEWIAGLDEQQIKDFTIAIIALVLAAKGLMFFSSFVMAVQALGPALAALSVIGPVLALILGLVAAVKLGWEHSEQFRRSVQEFLVPALQAFWEELGKLKKELEPILPLLGQVAGFLLSGLVVILWIVVRALTHVVQAIRIVIIGFRQMIDWLRANVPDIGAIVRGAARVVINHISDLVETIKEYWGKGWRWVIRKSSEFVGDVVKETRKIKDKVVNVFKNAGRWLWDAGKKIIEGLINGIKDKLPSMESIVSGIGGTIKRLKGPLSYDKVMLVPEGQAIMDGFMRGLESRMPQMHAQVTGVTTVIPELVRSANVPPAATIVRNTSTSSNRTVDNSVNIHLDGTIVAGSPKQVEDLFVNAYTKAVQKGRIRPNGHR